MTNCLQSVIGARIDVARRSHRVSHPPYVGLVNGCGRLKSFALSVLDEVWDTRSSTRLRTYGKIRTAQSIVTAFMG